MAGVFFYDGQWLDESPKLTGPMDHAFWMSSVVFDGARSFDGMVPDLDLHCERLIGSAEAMLLAPKLTAGEITELSRQAVRKFPKQAELYIRPMFFATEGFLTPEPDSTTFVLAVYESPLPEFSGIKVCLSTRRRPARDMAPTDAKASCLYPNTARALREASGRGFDNCIVLDANGNVAELASANVWIVKDGVAMTPAINGTFLNGITRQRMIQLFTDDGIRVEETTITFDDVMDADEVFSSGNYGKITPIVQVEDRDLQQGPLTKKARALYWDYAKSAALL